MNPEDVIERIFGLPSAPVAGGGPTAPGLSPGGPVVYYGPGKSVTIQPSRAARDRTAPLPDGNPSYGRPRARTAQGPDDDRPLDVVRGQVYEWFGTVDFDRWGDHLASLGLIEEDDKRDLQVLNAVWQDVVEEAANLRTAGKKLTPWQVAEILAGDPAAREARRQASRGFTGTRSMTATNTNIDLTDPMSAKALINDVLSAQLGRAASDEEVRAFTAAVNAAERANPAVTNTSTSTSYEDGTPLSSTSTSTTSGGITGAGRAQLIADDVMQKPEYGAYQAAALYFPVLQQALGATAAV